MSEPLHLKVKKGDIADRVIIAGDPARVKQVSGMLESPRLVNENRGFIAYTGKYEGVPVSVVTHGIGAPSVLIVMEELVKAGAKAVVRVGSCGALYKGSSIGEIVIPTGCVYYPGGPYYQYQREWVCGPAAPDFRLLENLVKVAEEEHINYRLGPVFSSDAFYAEDPGFATKWNSRGVIAVEMECAAVFMLGLMRGVKTAALFMVSDSLVEDLGFADAEKLRQYAERAAVVALKALLRTKI
jgi:5'-methylthioadenosine phosphorylase